MACKVPKICTVTSEIKATSYSAEALQRSLYCGYFYQKNINHKFIDRFREYDQWWDRCHNGKWPKLWKKHWSGEKCLRQYVVLLGSVPKEKALDKAGCFWFLLKGENRYLRWKLDAARPTFQYINAICAL